MEQIFRRILNIHCFHPHLLVCSLLLSCLCHHIAAFLGTLLPSIANQRNSMKRSVRLCIQLRQDTKTKATHSKKNRHFTIFSIILTVDTKEGKCQSFTYSHSFFYVHTVFISMIHLSLWHHVCADVCEIFITAANPNKCTMWGTSNTLPCQASSRIDVWISWSQMQWQTQTDLGKKRNKKRCFRLKLKTHCPQQLDHNSLSDLLLGAIEKGRELLLLPISW